MVMVKLAIRMFSFGMRCSLSSIVKCEVCCAFILVCTRMLYDIMSVIHENALHYLTHYVLPQLPVPFFSVARETLIACCFL